MGWDGSRFFSFWWVGSTIGKVLKIWKDYVNAFKARLDKIWLYQAVEFVSCSWLGRVGSKFFFACSWLGWVGSVRWWVGLDRFTQNGPTDNSDTYQFNSTLSGTTRVRRYRKGKTNLDFTEARDSEWQWHHLGRMQVYISLLTDNHASTTPLSFLQAGCPSCHPVSSVKALKALLIKFLYLLWDVMDVNVFYLRSAWKKPSITQMMLNAVGCKSQLLNLCMFSVASAAVLHYCLLFCCVASTRSAA